MHDVHTRLRSWNDKMLLYFVYVRRSVDTGNGLHEGHRVRKSYCTCPTSPATVASFARVNKKVSFGRTAITAVRTNISIEFFFLVLFTLFS